MRWGRGAYFAAGGLILCAAGSACWARQLVYQFSPGQHVIYDIKITAGSPRGVQTITGHVFQHDAAIEALGMTHDAGAAVALVKEMDDFRTRSQAERALIALGKPAESSVLPLLKNAQWEMRLSACQILTSIGTARSLPSLKSIANSDSNGLVSQQANKAIKAIDRRATPQSAQAH